jgi:hypothetical protein
VPAPQTVAAAWARLGFISTEQVPSGVDIPGTEVAAAAVAFTDMARLYLDGRVLPGWVTNMVWDVLSRVAARVLQQHGDLQAIRAQVMNLPLASLSYIAERSLYENRDLPAEQKTVLVREVCEEQLRHGTDADRVPGPQAVAAWARLGLVPNEEVPLWAAHWLVAGYDGEHLVHLAGLHGDDPCDVRDALPDALRDCGIELPASFDLSDS